MWYIIVIAVIGFLLYLYRKKQPSAFTVTVHVENDDWKKRKKEKERALKKLKKSFVKTNDLQHILNIADSCARQFIENHGYETDEIVETYNQIKLPDDPIKCELALRKELNKHYKNREDVKSKNLAIYIAFQHVKLQLSYTKFEWKNFLGLKRLQSNLKAEEYFDSLLKIMFYVLQTFPKLDSSKKLPDDIERIFQLWNSRNYAEKAYQKNCAAYEKVDSASDKHFIINDIIDYLERRYKFNPQYREELISWCKRDVELYEQFLIEFHEHQIFSIEDQMRFRDSPKLKQQKLDTIKLEHITRLKEYTIPRLNSYDVLEAIFKKDRNISQLAWLEAIGTKIKYSQNGNDLEIVPKTEEPEEIDYSYITKTIEVPKSGEKGKLAFLTSKGDACSTEVAYRDYMEQRNWSVMRAEVSFWQAMFCLSFWEEIFEDMHPPVKGYDIPRDLFSGEDFYYERQFKIDRKYDFLQEQSLKAFINEKIKNYRSNWTRLIYNGDQDMVAYFETSIVQEFLERIEPEMFAKIVYRIAQNPNENRAGVSDFVVWNEKELKMIEVKKVREKIRDSQKSWIAWMLEQSIPNEIVRVKGVSK